MPALEVIRPRLPERRPVSYESATAELIASSYGKSGRGTLYALTAFIVALIVFMSVFKLERLVKTPGRLVPIGGALTVQPLEKQIIRRVLVSVGDVVKKGQVLATCDATFVQADLVALQHKVAGLDAERRRVEAEIAGQPFVSSPDNPADEVQSTLWHRRQTEYNSGLADFDQRLASASAQIVQLRQDIVNYTEQVKIAAQVERMHTDLEKSGYVSRLQSLTAQNDHLTAARSLADSQQGLLSAQHLQESLTEQRKVFIDKWHEDALKELVDTQGTLGQAQQDLIKAQKLSDLVDLVAPEDAVVVSVPKFSNGAVAMDAQQLFGLMPLNAPLQADVHIDTHDIGFVHVGDKVSIKLDAYKFLEHGTVEGVVKTIGTDTMPEQGDDDLQQLPSGASMHTAPYYDARVALTAVKLHNVPADFHLIPGMTLQADIIVGQRTLMWYMVGGALRTGSEALHEP